MSNINEYPHPWQKHKCRVPMWFCGAPAGHCDEVAFGYQYPREYAERVLYFNGRLPYCFGHCCPDHGGPKEGEPIIFQDGYTEYGRPMYCAVMPGFVNLQESAAGFSDNPALAVKILRAALAESRGIHK